MKKVMTEAHKMTKDIKRKYPEVDYRFQLGLCLSCLLKNKKEENRVELPELKGTPKQIAWANKIRKDFIENRIPQFKEYYRNFLDLALASKKINEDQAAKMNKKIENILHYIISTKNESKFYIETPSNIAGMKEIIKNAYKEVK